MKSNFKKHLKYVFIFLFLSLSTFGFGQEPELMLPIGHTDIVISVIFSPDGKKILTSSYDGTAKIWDVESWKLLADLKEHIFSVNNTSFSPDGSKIVITSADSIGKIWDVESGKLITDLMGHPISVKTATLYPNGRKIVTTPWNDKLAIIWDVEGGKFIANLKGHTDDVHSAMFSPDRKKILTVLKDNTAEIWDVESGKLIADLTGHTVEIVFSAFSPDGKKIVTISDDRIVKIWDVESGKLIAELKALNFVFAFATFSPDGNKIVTASSYDGTAKIWDVESGNLVATLTEHDGGVNTATFSPDGKRILIASKSTVKIWDVESEKLITDLYGHTKGVNSATFSPDGTTIVTASNDNNSRRWDFKSGKLIVRLTGLINSVNSETISLDGKKIETVSKDNFAHRWDVKSGEPIAELYGVSWEVETIAFSSDGKKIATTSYIWGDTLKIWDIENGELVTDLIGNTRRVKSAIFSPDGKKIVTKSFSLNDIAKIWDVESGKLIADLKGQTDPVFSPDGKKIVTISRDKTAKIWDVESGKLITDLTGHTRNIESATFSPDGKKIVTISGDSSRVWDAENGKLIAVLTMKISVFETITFSPDGKKIVTVSWDDKIARIWDVESGKLVTDLIGHTNVKTATFSPNGKKIVTTSEGITANIWDVESGKLIADLTGHTNQVNSAVFSPDGTKIVTASKDNTIKIWDAENGALLYTFVAVDQSDYLAFDSNGRYDGTEGARDYLYFTCGTEIIDLAQMKDALYVPGLVEKIRNGQDINYPKLSDLDICDALPLVEHIENTEGNYFYKITARKLGLEYVEIYVNSKKVMNISKDELQLKDGVFHLKLKEADVKKHFLADSENKVNVVAIARQSGNELRSRGANVVVVDEKKENLVVPKLFAVMIGVNDYKDQVLNLNYPVKDANELGKAIELSAQKLLGKDNVIMYSINSEVKAGNGYTTPEKEGIKRALADIGEKAQPEDLIMLFFAGHGVMQSGDEKLFTFLTAEASQSNQIGITTKELQNWLSYEGPNKILANKTILIFDACNSGQATQELMAMARSDDDTRRIRQVEDLKDKSGMFILAASAPNQAAYELPQYEQGLLTYSLLSVLKNNSDILDDGKFLNVQKWFLESEKYLQQLMASLGLKQDAQPFGTANIRIGEVDEDVKRSIQLAVEKPMVICANVLNDTTFDDDLGLKSIINASLAEISERGVNQSIVYPRKETDNANKINIRYTLRDETVLCEVRLLKSGETLHNIKITGSKSDLNGLVTDIIQEIVKYVK